MYDYLVTGIAILVVAFLSYEACKERNLCLLALTGLALILYAQYIRLTGREPTEWEVLLIILIAILVITYVVLS